jgi:hypothetical protein
VNGRRVRCCTENEIAAGSIAAMQFDRINGMILFTSCASQVPPPFHTTAGEHCRNPYFPGSKCDFDQHPQPQMPIRRAPTKNHIRCIGDFENSPSVIRNPANL